MLRALLEDRFQLKTHRATADQPAYILTVSKNGLNASKVKPTAPGDCWPNAVKRTIEEYRNGPPVCGGQLFGHGKDGAKSVQWKGTTMADFLNTNGGLLDRFVVDQTGLSGQFNIEFDFAPDDRTPGYPWPADFSASGAGKSVFKGIEEIGLHLEPSKAPAGYIAIDRVERPSPNGPEADALPPSRARPAGRAR
jgi:uncharacterized protein (TIGR03435 family)